jgi:ABC-type Fe3+/spermidine/putrescine transport system ATPase subunit
MSDKIALLNQGRLEQFGSPLELYDRPRTRFAASFLGSSNLIRGHIFRDLVVGSFFQADNFRIPLENCGLPEQTQVTLMLRPEHLAFDTSPSEQSLPGTVDFVTQFGHSTQYEVKLDAGPMFLVSLARGRDVTPVSTGSRVFLSPNGPSAYQVIVD